MKNTTVYTSTEKDFETGEIKSTKFITKTVKTKEEFVILYMKHIALIAKLPHFELQTLLCLAPNIEWETGEFTLDSKTMSKITECSGLGEGSIRNAISKLKKKNIVQRKKTNWYQLNPDLFWKGSEIEREKQFTLSYQWNIKEELNTPIEEQKNTNITIDV